MALEDIIKGFDRFNTAAQIEATLKEDPYSREARQNFSGYIHKYEGINEADAQDLGQTQSIDALRTQLVNIQSRAKNNLVEVAKSNYDAVLGALPKDDLVNYALRLGKVSITEDLINDALKNKNYDGLKKVLTRKYSTKSPNGEIKFNPYWIEVISSTEDLKLLVSLSHNYANEEKNKFIAKNLGSKQKDAKGKEKYVVDSKKLTDYVKKEFGKLKDEHKNSEYVQLASLYTNYKASKK